MSAVTRRRAASRAIVWSRICAYSASNSAHGSSGAAVAIATARTARKRNFVARGRSILASMLRVQPVFDSALVSIERIDHPADIPHVDPPEEMSRTCSINLLERGGFAVAIGEGVGLSALTTS